MKGLSNMAALSSGSQRLSLPALQQHTLSLIDRVQGKQSKTAALHRVRSEFSALNQTQAAVCIGKRSRIQLLGAESHVTSRHAF